MKFNYVHPGSNVMLFRVELATQVNIQAVKGHLVAAIGIYTIISEPLRHPMPVTPDSVKNQYTCNPTGYTIFDD